MNGQSALRQARGADGLAELQGEPTRPRSASQLSPGRDAFRGPPVVFTLQDICVQVMPGGLAYAAMPRAMEQVRRMRGGAQAHLMRCDDGFYYVVKFHNNPQAAYGGRILLNELLGSRLTARLGLPVPPVAVVHVSRELIEGTADLEMQLGLQHVRCEAGPQFGSRYPGQPAEVAVHDFLPDETLREIPNLADFAGMHVVDKWLCNCNGRQAIFYREPEHIEYRAMFVDQGFFFNAGEWNFPDAPLRGIYLRHRVYDGVTGMESFEPWLARLEHITPTVLDELASEIPPAWYGYDQGELYRLLEQIDRRRKRVPDLILQTRSAPQQPFRNWR